MTDAKHTTTITKTTKLTMALRDGKSFKGPIPTPQKCYRVIVSKDTSANAFKCASFDGTYTMTSDRPFEAMGIVWLFGGQRYVVDCSPGYKHATCFDHVDAIDIRYVFLAKDDATRNTLKSLGKSDAPAEELGKLFKMLQPMKKLEHKTPLHIAVWCVDGEQQFTEYYDPQVVTIDQFKQRLIDLYEPIRLGWVSAEEPICLSLELGLARSKLCDCEQCKLLGL